MHAIYESTGVLVAGLVLAAVLAAVSLTFVTCGARRTLSQLLVLWRVRLSLRLGWWQRFERDLHAYTDARARRLH